jgi:hypothetical protein
MGRRRWGVSLGMTPASIAMNGVTMRHSGGGGSGRIVSFRHDSIRFRGRSLSEFSGLGLAAPWPAASTYRPTKR